MNVTSSLTGATISNDTHPSSFVTRHISSHSLEGLDTRPHPGRVEASSLAPRRPACVHSLSLSHTLVHAPGTEVQATDGGLLPQKGHRKRVVYENLHHLRKTKHTVVHVCLQAQK